MKRTIRQLYSCLGRSGLCPNLADSHAQHTFCLHAATRYVTTKFLVSCLAAGVTALLTASSARAQADLTFSGGGGLPLELTLDAPVVYLITSAAGEAPFFVFAGTGFTTDATVSGTITYTVNGGAAQTVSTLNSGISAGALTADDSYIYGFPAGVPVNATVRLDAGSLMTTSSFSGTLPANGSYSTFIIDGTGNRLDAVNGLAVPEPSTCALLSMGAGLLGLTMCRRSPRFPHPSGRFEPTGPLSPRRKSART